MLQPSFSNVETTTMSFGTPAYAAPEMFKNPKFTNKVDVYSFGRFFRLIFTNF